MICDPFVVVMYLLLKGIGSNIEMFASLPAPKNPQHTV
jgi:hypothetical protein